MPRRSSGRFAPSPAPRRATPPATARSAPSPAPASSGGGSMLGNLGAAIIDGVGWGTGTAVAHRAVDSVMGPRTVQVVDAGAAAATPAAVNDACSMHTDAFTKCLNSSGSDISKCQFYMDMLNECRNSSGSMTSA